MNIFTGTVAATRLLTRRDERAQRLGPAGQGEPVRVVHAPVEHSRREQFALDRVGPGIANERRTVERPHLMTGRPLQLLPPAQGWHPWS
jgi:hypothetical protein